MKLYQLFILTALPLLCLTHPVTEETDENNDAIVVEDSDHAESENSQVSKRSFQLLQSLKSNFLGGVGRASASLVSAGSGGSGSYKTEVDHSNSVSFDPIGLKKSILSTIINAVKAITGGVTAIKGQLLKGSGYALAAGGNLVAASGDKVTDVGKAIVHSAQLGVGGPSDSNLFVSKFGKFSSLSGASSGSGGHPVAGPVTHGETITTYEIPSGHGSYGPPSKPPSFGSTQYLPAGFGGGAHFTGAAAFEDSPSGWSKYGLPLEGPPGHYGQLNSREAHSAAEALKEIEHLLPLTTTNTEVRILPISKKPVFEQYPIPKDPSSGSYEHHSNPSDPVHEFKPNSNSGIKDSDSYIIEDFNDSDFSRDVLSSHPWDVYHSMSVKNKPKNHQRHPSNNNSQNSLTPLLATLASSNTKSPYRSATFLESSASQNHPSFLPPPQSLTRRRPAHSRPHHIDFRFRRTKLYPKTGKTFEMHKSLGFQIRDPAHFNRQLLY